MPTDTHPQPEECNCLAVRQAARHVTQFYDQIMAPAGLRTTQFAILAKLRRLGPLTINALAATLVMDRTTLGRTISLAAVPQFGAGASIRGRPSELMPDVLGCGPIIWQSNLRSEP